jgi:hypothetical protein
MKEREREREKETNKQTISQISSWTRETIQAEGGKPQTRRYVESH